MFKTAKKVFGAGVGALAFVAALTATGINGIVKPFSENPKGFDDPTTLRKYAYDFKQIGSGLTWGLYQPEEGVTIENTVDLGADALIKTIDVTDRGLRQAAERTPDVLSKLNEVIRATSDEFNTGAETPRTADESRRIICAAIENPSEELNCP